MVHSVTGPCGQPVSARHLERGRHGLCGARGGCGPAAQAAHFSAANIDDLGAGQLIGEALNAGHRRIVITLAAAARRRGLAWLAALGVRFTAPNGRNFIPTGATLGAIRHIAPQSVLLESGVRIEALCDVTNPLCGPERLREGLGPQKGATPEMVETMEAGMAHLATIFERNKGPKFADMPCAGAAGGCGAGRRRLPQRQASTAAMRFLT